MDTLTQSVQLPSLSQPVFLVDWVVPLPAILHPARTISSGLPLSKMISLGFFQIFFVADIRTVTPEIFL